MWDAIEHGDVEERKEQEGSCHHLLSSLVGRSSQVGREELAKAAWETISLGG